MFGGMEAKTNFGSGHRKQTTNVSFGSMPTDEEECDKSLKQPDSQMRLRMLNGPQWIKYRSYYISYI